MFCLVRAMRLSARQPSSSARWYLDLDHAPLVSERGWSRASAASWLLQGSAPQWWGLGPQILNLSRERSRKGIDQCTALSFHSSRCQPSRRLLLGSLSDG